MEPQHETGSGRRGDVPLSKRLLRYAVLATALVALAFFVVDAAIFVPGLDMGPDGGESVPAPGEPVTVAMARLVGGGVLWPSYLDVLEHISGSTGRPVETMLLYEAEGAAGTFRDHPEIDGAFMSIYGYLLARESDPRITRLVTPVIDGRGRERAVLVVRANSPYEHLRDLAGARVLLMECSLAGGAYVRWLLHEEGMGSAEGFFGGVEITGSQDESLHGVIRGEADATAVNLSQLASWPADSFRVIATSEEYGMPPFVISPDLPESEAEALTDALLGYEASADGTGNGELERFLTADPSDYEFPLELLRFLGSGVDLGGSGAR